MSRELEVRIKVMEDLVRDPANGPYLEEVLGQNALKALKELLDEEDA